MGKNGSNKKYLGVESSIDKVTWSQDSKTVLAITNIDGADGIIKIDIDTKQTTNLWQQENSASKIHRISLLGDGKIVMFETDEGVYALATD
jgi:hypothetical protein